MLVIGHERRWTAATPAAHPVRGERPLLDLARSVPRVLQADRRTVEDTIPDTHAPNRRLGGQRSDSNAAGLENHERSRQPFADLFDQAHHGGTQVGPRSGRIADQDDARGLLTGCMDELTEVLVLRERHEALIARQPDDFGVTRSACRLRHGNHVMTACAQFPHHDCVAAFISEEAHARSGTSGVGARQHDLLVCDGVRGVGQGGLDVLDRKVRIGVATGPPVSRPR